MYGVTLLPNSKLTELRLLHILLNDYMCELTLINRIAVQIREQTLLKAKGAHLGVNCAK